MLEYNIIEGGVCAAEGFSAGGLHVGIKAGSNKKDLAVIYCENKCNAAALFTQNKVKAAPIKVSKAHLADGKAQAIIVNSGNANACTANGIEIAEKMCELSAKSLGISCEDVIVASTGVIGQELAIAPFEKGIPALVANLNKAGNDDAAQAIMTTDTFPKQVAIEFELSDGTKCKIGGIAKGSGMINPNMATMLAFITTDIDISAELLEWILPPLNSHTFNAVSVDGDTSTNDMLCIMASGLAGNKKIVVRNEDYGQFAGALNVVMTDLARKMARDGEGATKLIECYVENAPDDKTANSIAKSVVSSSLVKAAIGAADANWGRILCAMGYAADIADDFDVSKADVKLGSAKGEVIVCRNGMGVPFSEKEATAILSEEEVQIYIDLHHPANVCGRAFGCDLTEEYVRINADYRS